MSFLSKLFQTEKKDTTYNGTKPLTSLTQTLGGKEYYQSLVDRMAGRGVGYGDAYVSSANPIIANLRSQFTGYDLPELKSELSATGRRKGSAGFAQIDKAYRQQGLNENDILAQLIQRNEEQKRNEINAAVSGMGNFAQNEANMANEAANFEYADNARQVQEANARRQRVGDLRMQGIQTGLGMSGYGLMGLGKPTSTSPTTTNTLNQNNLPWWMNSRLNPSVTRNTLRIA